MRSPNYGAVPKVPGPHPHLASLSFTTFCQSLIFMFIAQILALLHTRSLNFENRKMARQLLGGGVNFGEQNDVVQGS